jgi:hypothetical protein
MRVLCFLLAMTAVASADPLVPPELGCWEVGGRFTEGARITLTKKTAGGIRVRSMFPRRPRGGPPVFVEDAVPVPGSTELQVLCRPTSQHGSFCRIAREGDGLRVRVYAFGFGQYKTGRLVENFVASRCR